MLSNMKLDTPFKELIYLNEGLQKLNAKSLRTEIIRKWPAFLSYNRTSPR